MDAAETRKAVPKQENIARFWAAGVSAVNGSDEIVAGGGVVLILKSSVVNSN